MQDKLLAGHAGVTASRIGRQPDLHVGGILARRDLVSALLVKERDLESGAVQLLPIEEQVDAGLVIIMPGIVLPGGLGIVVQVFLQHKAVLGQGNRRNPVDVILPVRANRDGAGGFLHLAAVIVDGAGDLSLTQVSRIGNGVATPFAQLLCRGVENDLVSVFVLSILAGIAILVHCIKGNRVALDGEMSRELILRQVGMPVQKHRHLRITKTIFQHFVYELHSGNVSIVAVYGDLPGNDRPVLAII